MSRWDPLSIANLAIRIAMGPWGKIVFAISSAFSNPLVSDAWLTTPYSLAFTESKISPVKISSFALGTPISLGNLWVPPALPKKKVS